MRRLSTILGVLLTGAALLHSSSCSRASKALLQGMDRDLRMQEACAGFLANQESSSWQGSTTTGALVGDDPDAYRRLLTTLAGWPREGDPPWAKMMDQLTEAGKDYPAGWKALLDATNEKLRTPIDDGFRDWKRFRTHAEALVNQLASTDALSALRKCAESKLGAATNSHCGFDAIDADLRKLRTMSAALENDAKNLRKRSEEIIAGLNDVVALGEQLGGAARSDFAFLLAEVAAFAGMLRDMGRLAEDVRRGLGSEAPLRELSKLVVAANSDWVADVAIYWLQRGVHRLEEQLERLDEQTYGLTTVFYGASLKSNAAEQGVCALTTGVYSALLEAGLSPGAFGSRVCEELADDRAEAGLEARSELLTLVYLSILGAEGALDCKELRRKSGGLLDLTGYEVPSDVAPPPDPRFTTLGGDTLSLATADWQMRVKLQENHLSAMPDVGGQEPLTVDALPSLDRASADVRAPLLLATRSRAVVAGAQSSLHEEHVEYQHTMRDGLGLARGGLRSLEQERTVCMWTHESDMPANRWWGASIPACAPVVERWRRDGLCMEECGCCCQASGGGDGGDSPDDTDADTDTGVTSSGTGDTGQVTSGDVPTGGPHPEPFYYVDIRQPHRLKLFIVLDRSATMTVKLHDGNTRWHHAKKLALEVVSGLTHELKKDLAALDVDIGALYFEGMMKFEVVEQADGTMAQNHENVGKCVASVGQDVALVDDLEQLYRNIEGYGAPGSMAFTPTHAGVQTAAEQLGKGGEHTLSRIILITDARNNCASSEGSADVYHALEAARGRKISTYLATFDVREKEEDPRDQNDAARQRVLRRMVASGGAPGGDVPLALDVLGVRETAKQLVNSVEDELRSGWCELDISEHVKHGEFEEVQGQRPEDYRLSRSGRMLRLEGQACRQLMSTGVVRVWFRSKHATP